LWEVQTSAWHIREKRSKAFRHGVPTNADIPELDVIFAGEFDSEASLLGSKRVGRIDRCFRGARNSQRGLSRHWEAHS
jgi:hypothetical protein